VSKLKTHTHGGRNALRYGPRRLRGRRIHENIDAIMKNRSGERGEGEEGEKGEERYLPSF